MHELGLAQGILDVARGLAAGREVSRVTVRVGRLHRVVPDSLEFGFQLVAEGTEAAGATLVVVDVPALMRCRGCGAEGPLDDGVPVCAACGSVDVAMAAGDELLVDEVALAGVEEPLRRPGTVFEEPPHEPGDHDAGPHAHHRHDHDRRDDRDHRDDHDHGHGHDHRDDGDHAAATRSHAHTVPAPPLAAPSRRTEH